LTHVLVEEHADQRRERVVAERLVDRGVLCKRQGGHTDDAA
jgi:hypothetical protein